MSKEFDEWFEANHECYGDSGNASLRAAVKALAAVAYQAGRKQGLMDAYQISDELHLDFRRDCSNRDAAIAILTEANKL